MHVHCLARCKRKKKRTAANLLLQHSTWTREFLVHASMCTYKNSVTLLGHCIVFVGQIRQGKFVCDTP